MGERSDKLEGGNLYYDKWTSHVTFRLGSMADPEINTAQRHSSTPSTYMKWIKDLGLGLEFIAQTKPAPKSLT